MLLDLNNLAGLIKKEPALAALAVLSALLIILFFCSTGADLWQSWSTPEYSYAYLVPVIALYWGCTLFAQRRPALHPTYQGVALVAFAIFASLFGDIAASNWIHNQAIVVLCIGIVLACAGWETVKTVWPALFFLVFAIPLPAATFAGLTAKLQLMSSTLSVDGLNLLNVPVYQEGNILDLGSYRLEVAAACSGLRYLFPFICFGYLFGFLFETSLWKRAALLLVTVPISIFLNAARIMATALAVDHGGIGMAEGFWHEFEGWVVFIGCIACLFATSWLLSFIGPAPKKPAATPASRTAFMPAGLSKILAALVVTLAVGLAAQDNLQGDAADRTPPRTNFATFPMRIDNWQGNLKELPPDQLAALHPTDYVIADYRADDTAWVINFYSAFYASQRREASPHSPLICIPGSGWEITSLQTHYEIGGVAVEGHPLMVNRAVIYNGKETELVYFWFRERGRDLTTTVQRKWYLFRDALTEHRTDGALIRVVIPIDGTVDAAAGDKILTDFLAKAAPRLGAFIPD